jgi:hypothetical protein
MLQPLRRNPSRNRVSTGKSVPAPVEGWDAISPLAAMDPKRAITLDNYFCRPGYVEIRRGYTSWGTGLGAPSAVNTLMAYNGLTVAASKLFAIANATIYDVTSAGAGSATSVTTLTSSKAQYINYTTSAGTAYLMMCNGADSVRTFDGSSWAAPSITGITSSNVININAHKKYIWLVHADRTTVYYLPLDSISGAATAFPLGSVMGGGGYIVAMGTWTRDGGAGPDDFAVFVSSEGQVIVYAGTDPATDFELVGVYNLPRPIGLRCLTKVAGDLAIITVAGVLPLSKALTQEQGSVGAVAMTLRINDAMRTAAASYSGIYGWQLVSFPKETMAILNVPLVANTTSHQFVMNVLTGGWSRWTGIAANCWETFQNALYWGGNGVVYKGWNGGKDGSSQINADMECAFNYFGAMGRQKRFVAVQPLITTASNSIPSIGIATDFKDNATDSTPTAATITGAMYDTALYDTDVYATESISYGEWTTVGAIGQCASIHCRAASNATEAVTIRVNGFNLVYEQGEFY